MKRDWKQYLKYVLAWTGLASTTVSSVWNQADASAAVPAVSTRDNEPMLGHINGSAPLPLTFTFPGSKDVHILIAGHRSHSSHSSRSSHRSHYSGSNGGYYYSPVTPSYSPSPSSGTFSYPSVPRQTPEYLQQDKPAQSDLEQLQSEWPSPIAQRSKALVNCNPDGQSHPTEDTILIMKVQVELIHQGFYTGAVDGINGPATQEALRCFQHQSGLQETSEIDVETLRRLQISN